MMTDACPICKKLERHFLFDGEDRLYFLPGKFKLYQCCGCRLIRVLPPLSESELAQYYPEHYYSYESSRLVAPLRDKREKLFYYLGHPFQALNCLVYSKLMRQNQDLPSQLGDKVLDVGCGEGRYLLEKKQEGAQCFGVDINKNALNRLRETDSNIAAFCGNIWDATFPDDFFDLINLSHVLEHVASVERFLTEVRRILKPQGKVRVQVPNVASLSFVLFQKYWMPLDVPRHVYAFSISNLKQLFNAVGFEVVKFRTLENSFSVIGSLFYVFNALFGKKVALMNYQSIWDHEILKFLLFPYSFAVNFFKMGDTAEFILKKK